MIEVDGHQIGRGADPVLYCSWSSQHDLIALASDDCIVSIFKSDHGWPDRLEKGADHAQSKQGTAENTKIKISYQHVQQKIESYANDESIRGMYRVSTRHKKKFQNLLCLGFLRRPKIFSKIFYD